MEVFILLPGINIKDLTTYQNRINEILNPNNESYIKLIKEWKLINTEVYDIIKELHYNNYYILYEHPVHEFKNRLSEVTKKELLGFIHNNFFSAENDGIDVTIATKDFSVIFVCNHDDEIYIAKSS